MLNRKKNPKFTTIDCSVIDESGYKFDEIHYAAIREYSKDYKNGVYLEIGSNYGHSAYQAWLSMKPTKMVLVDIFDEKRMIPVIKRTLTSIECLADVYIYQCTSNEYFEKHGSGKLFDFILVDGSHQAEDAKRDLENAWEALVPGGIILFDDIELQRLSGVWERFAKNKSYSFLKRHEEWKHGVAVIRKKI